MRLQELIRDIKTVIRMYGDVKSIARRMFVTNSIDSIVAALGVSVGGFSPEANTKLLAMGIIGGGVAMGSISAMLGVYLSERAERLREYRDLERKLAHTLKDSIHWKAAKLIPFYVALWSGFGALIFPSLIALPFILASAGIFNSYSAYLISLGVGLASMGLLGLYLSRVSGESPIHSILRAIGMGILAILIVSALKIAVV